MDIRTFQLKDLRPSEYNPRTITPEALQGLQQSIEKFGYIQPLIVNWPDVLEPPVIVGGHQRLKVLQAQGVKEAKCIVVNFDPVTEKAANVALNAETISGDWSLEGLESILAELSVEFPEFEDINLDELADSLDIDLDSLGEDDSDKDADEVPDLPQETSIKLGDLIELGVHKVLCGDSTKAEDVKRLMGEEKAVLLHADPPYGMGKEKEGVQNDNLYREKLDKFLMEFWQTYRPYLEDNASVYIWGNAEDLWRLWYQGGLKASERLTFRNEIIWDKGSGQGMESDQHRMFPTATERCFFFMLGEQGFNKNADNYWEGWEPIRKYLKDERDKMNWNNKVVADFFGFHPRMADHWFSQSQWSFIQEDQYKMLQIKAKNKGFKKDYKGLKKDYKGLKKEFYSTRAYFENTHENMTDVWQYPRVKGEERQGHATPKPVEMLVRAVKSSSPKHGLVIEPFLGSGSTLIACEKTKRRCYGMEIDPHYVFVIVSRWVEYTGKREVTINGEVVNWEKYAGGINDKI